MANTKLNLTRDQLALFLKDHESIKQFERLFAVVDAVAPDSDTPGISVQAGNAQSAAEQAIGMVLALTDAVLANCAVIDAKTSQSIGQVVQVNEELSTSIATTDNKANQALQLIAQLSQAVNDLAASSSQSGQSLEMLAKLAKDVEGLQSSPPAREFKRARYGQFYDTNTQIAAAINTPQAITFNTTDVSKGVFLGTPSSRIYIDTEGVYNFLYSIQIDKTSGGTGIFWVWPRINGVDVPDSNSQVQIQGNNAEQLVTVGYFFELKAGDYVEIMFAVNDISVQVEYFPASAFYPAIPSIILTVSNNIQGVQ
jgi:hypothetical protein